MLRACRVQKTCGHAVLSLTAPPRPPPPSDGPSDDSLEYNMHYAKSVILTSDVRPRMPPPLAARVDRREGAGEPALSR
ncbi:unnamed protein product [Leptosia nina]|uniref:Uncharacterized protein n=1 Tax=Leptosia nina TaxID=320188 RepID=A0AAV1IWS0_9NEOP